MGHGPPSPPSLSPSPQEVKAQDSCPVATSTFHSFSRLGFPILAGSRTGEEDLEVRLAAVQALRSLVPAFPAAWPGVVARGAGGWPGERQVAVGPGRGHPLGWIYLLEGM